MQFGGSAPAFTLSADGQMSIASVVSEHNKNDTASSIT